MKAAYLVLAIPFLLYLGAAVVLDPGALVPMYPDSDLTGYLAAVSLARDGNLDYTRADSDRYFRDHGTRPAPFRVLQKKMIDAKTGQFKSYYVFHNPDLFVYILAPFVGLLKFRGWLLLHALLVLGLYLLGWWYYRGKDPDAISPAINSVIYFTLIGLPLLFLLPSHHLYLLATSTAFLFFGLRRVPILSAVFLALMFSSQPWAAVFALFLIGYWQVTKSSENQNPIPRFVVVLIAAFFVVWGLERLMYPVSQISEPRWITDGFHAPLASIWKSLPDASAHGWAAPNGLRLSDFLFGRNSGFFVYAFVPAALILSSVWLLRDPLIRTALFFVVLFLALVACVHTSAWNAESFTNDFAILLAPLPFFLVPLIRPKALFVSIAIPAAFLAGPLLLNPLGAISNRSDYTYSFPYRYLPIEISLAGRAGITKDKEYQQQIPAGKVYFLNNSFYKEGDYFWLRGESTLEFLLEISGRQPALMEIRNGVQENKITVRFGDSEQVIRLNAVEAKVVDFTPDLAHAIAYDGKMYLHGQIKTNIGYVPGLLARDNPDYRFLSCQIQFKSPDSALRLCKLL